jgi:hypothetical protein
MTPVTIAVFVLGAVLITLVASFVAAPLFRPPAPLGAAAAPDARDGWERQKRNALAAIKELELDHQMGKVSDEDLTTMRARFETQALEAMAVLEREGRA